MRIMVDDTRLITAPWRAEVAKASATGDPRAFGDGLSAGYAGRKRKCPREFHRCAGSWYSGHDLGVKGAGLRLEAA